MKKIILLLILFVAQQNSAQKKVSKISDKQAITQLLDSWHQAAAEADFTTYFSKVAPDFNFIGTDATENWNLEQFKKYAKPHFDKGKAWHFTSLQKNIYVGADNKTAWFDELLDTQMKICRGSGILEKTNNQWRLKHYVLSMTIPNEVSAAVILKKEAIETKILKQLKAEK